LIDKAKLCQIHWWLSVVQLAELEVSHAATHLNVYLPLGSAEGPYDIRIVTISFTIES
jgi:hypothetical protein